MNQSDPTLLSLQNIIAKSRPRRLSDEDLDALAMTIPIVIKRYDPNLRCIYINSDSERFTHKPPSWFIGRHLDDYEGYPQEFVSAIKNSIHRILETGEPQIFEASLPKPNGIRRRIHHQCPEYNEEGALVSIVSLSIDVTEKHDSTTRLEKTLSEQNEFLAMLGHELRNPLSAVSNGLHALEREPSQEISKTVREMMRKELTHITRLIEDLLDTARLETGALKYHKTECHLQDCLDLALDIVRPVIHQAEQKIMLTGDSSDIHIFGDTNRLAQAISNLLHNASKFSRRGTSISIIVDVIDGALRIDVADQGIGIPPHIQEKIFERYTQGRRDHDSRSSGIGLGLFVSREIIREHGGDITIAYSSEMGSAFRISLPVHERHKSLAPQAPTLPSRTTATSILVIDDNVGGLESMKLLLELHGHRVLTATTAAQGAQLYARHTPSVVILDIGLPDINGRLLARHLRLISREVPALFIALTGRGTDHDKLLSFEAGFDAHLTKPANIDELSALISNHFNETLVEGLA